MLQKQGIDISFAKGLDTKTDPWRVPLGGFLSLVNSQFDKNGQLSKRNGFGLLPEVIADGLTTFQGGLLGLGATLSAYTGNGWSTQGSIPQTSVSVRPLIRSAANQSTCDSATIGALTCVAYTETANGSTSFKYAVLADGSSLISPTALPSANASYGTPRVFALGNYFLVVYGAGSANLSYIAISRSTLAVTGPTALSTQFSPAATVPFDAVVANNALYLAWNGSDIGNAVRLTVLHATLAQGTTKVYATEQGTSFSVIADTTLSSPNIYVTYANSSGLFTLVVDSALNAVLAPMAVSAQTTLTNITGWAESGAATLYYETPGTWHLINTNTITSAGVAGSETTFLRGVGLASKAFRSSEAVYFLTAFSSPAQPSYFLVDDSAAVVGKLAYQNGGGYVSVLPNATTGIAYLFKDLVQSANKGTGTQANPIYTQTGVNLASWTTGVTPYTAETANNLHLSGGILSMYDGIALVEHGFNVYPDAVTGVTATTGGFLTAQAYYYQVVYSWTDGQGNVHVSAPSIPNLVDASGSGTSTNKNTLTIPTLRLTSKTNVKIDVYRWSTAQQSFYRTTSITNPTLNTKAADTISYVDTLADSSIIGNPLLYTTGGVLENIAAPATNAMALWQSRLWLIDAEDENLLWFSQPIVEATPVQMSDLLTEYISPTQSVSTGTGPNKALSAMDDKLILFKPNAIYYIYGQGPDATGANNQYSDPVYITATVGCSNPNSIVFIPAGLMFQSDKGIWLLGRDLSTNYIGAPVEAFNDATVLSAQVIPGTNQVRFLLSTGITLVYDYFYQQWATFSVNGISGTLFNSLHTIVDPYGRVLQETPGLFVDGSAPVEMSFTTSWIQLAGLQGYQRAYFFYILGQNLSQHTLNMSVAFDYEAPSQSVTITPTAIAAYGVDTPYGQGSPYGGSGVEQYRIFMKQQRCQAFQILVQETASSGAGLTLSGINCVVGLKKSFKPISAAKSR